MKKIYQIIFIATSLASVSKLHTFADYRHSNGYDDITQMMKNNVAIFHKLLSSVSLGTEYGQNVWQIDIDDNYILQLPMSGISKEKVSINVENYRIIVKGTDENTFFKPIDKETAKRQISYAFEYSLPPDSEIEKIEAKMENGLLTIMVPKLGKAKPKTISIK